jgi:predicted metalloprotease with PDZ domain
VHKLHLKDKSHQQLLEIEQFFLIFCTLNVIGHNMKYFLLFLIVSSVITAQPKIEYEVSFPNYVHHEAEVKVTYSGLKDDTLKIVMSRTSPGRYALHEFSKNIYNVKAEDDGGNKLSIFSPNLHQWNIYGHNGFVVFSYTLFGDRIDGTYTAIDISHAHLNIPASFVWAKNLENYPIKISFKIPEGSSWKAATQLVPTGEPFTFTAPDVYYFLDSPIELSDHTVREWKVSSDNRTYTIKLALHHTGTEIEADVYAKLAEAVVLEQKEIFGEMPKLDFGEYIFIADYLPYAKGDGMEHRNSTILSSSLSLNKSATRLLRTLSHEFFHAWSVERLRPKSLEPFNFEDVNISEELWFVEGFTSYYDKLVLHRAGVISLDALAKLYGDYFNIVINSPGRKYYSAAGMSRQAPFVDAAVSVDEQNKENTFISYYVFGAVIGLGLDLTLRSTYNITLDDFMKEAWNRFGKDEIPYTNSDLQKILADLTNDPEFAVDFFERFIYGKEIADFESLLPPAGFMLHKAKEGKASLGSIEFDEVIKIKNAILINTPLYKAGVIKGDKILELAGEELLSEKDYYRIVEAHRIGDEVEIKFEQRGKVIISKMIFEEDPAIELIPFEHISIPVTSDIEKFRDSWLGSKAGEKLPLLLKNCSECRREYEFKYEYCPLDGAILNMFE